MSQPCPCTSGKPYSACCAPYHRGVREAETASTLVRTRYAAFALGEIEYLYRTLHEDHPDRASHGKQHVLSALRAASSSFKYMGLVLLDAADPSEDAAGAAGKDVTAQVLYHAKIFRKGSDVSFVELADFLREAGPTGPFRYRAGKVKDAAAVKHPLATLKIADFQREFGNP